MSCQLRHILLTWSKSLFLLHRLSNLRHRAPSFQSLCFCNHYTAAWSWTINFVLTSMSNDFCRWPSEHQRIVDVTFTNLLNIAIFRHEVVSRSWHLPLLRFSVFAGIFVRINEIWLRLNLDFEYTRQNVICAYEKESFGLTNSSKRQTYRFSNQDRLAWLQPTKKSFVMICKRNEIERKRKQSSTNLQQRTFDVLAEFWMWKEV